MTALRMIGMGSSTPREYRCQPKGSKCRFLPISYLVRHTACGCCSRVWSHLFKIAPAILAAGGEGLKAKAFAALQDPRVHRISLRLLRAFPANLVLSKQLVAA